MVVLAKRKFARIKSAGKEKDDDDDKEVKDADLLEELCDEVGTTSVWTADLAWLLAKREIPMFFRTVTWGVDDSYAAFEFYSGVIGTDRERVIKRLEDVKEHGECSSISIDDIIDRLRSGSLFIVLVDLSKLVDSRAPWTMSLERSLLSNFAGHYILLLNVAPDGDILFADPSYTPTTKSSILSMFDSSSSSSPQWGKIAPEALDRARKSHGTDEDIIEIFG